MHLKYTVKQNNYLSRSLAVMAFATVRSDSLNTLGYILCWKQCIWTLMCTYLRRILLVSSWVLKEFIRTSGMLHPYFLFKCWNIDNVIIIWHFPARIYQEGRFALRVDYGMNFIATPPPPSPHPLQKKKKKKNLRF